MAVKECPKVKKKKVFVAIVIQLRNNHFISLCLTHSLLCSDFLLSFPVKLLQFKGERFCFADFLYQPTSLALPNTAK